MRGPQREKWKTNYVIQQESKSWMDDGWDREREMGRRRESADRWRKVVRKR